MWSTVQNISQRRKKVFSTWFLVMSFRKILENLQWFFPSSLNRKYVHTFACTVVFVRPAHFVFNAYPGRYATCTCPLSSSSNKNDGPRGRFNCISTVSCKGSVCVEVLTSFFGRFFIEEGQFIKYAPSTSSLHFRQPFFAFSDPASLCHAESSRSQPLCRNSFHMVCIVLKITFLKLRYPKGVAGRLPLCPIMALEWTQYRARPAHLGRAASAISALLDK